MAGPPLLLGVDVGGTTMAAGAVTRQGEVVLEESVATYRDGPGTVIATLVDLIARTRVAADRRGHAISGIGIGVPGPVEVEAGRIGEPVIHVPELAGHPLVRELTERFALPVFVDNDVNALVLAEWMFDRGRAVRSLVMLALGTGIGGGLVLQDRLIRGAVGFGGELGHVPVNFDGPPCFCGGRGCLSVYASSRGIVETAQARVARQPDAPLLRAAGGNAEAIDPPLVFQLAAEGDAIATSIVDDACQALGAMIATVVNGLNPEVLVITGGLAEALAPLEARIVKAASEYAFVRPLATTKLAIRPGDKRLTMRGAAALVLYEIVRGETRR
jgi:glucokinase